MPPLAFGLYERLITRALRAKLDALEREGAAVARVAPLDPAEAHARLARHVEGIVARTLGDLHDSGRSARQADVANRIVALLAVDPDTRDRVLDEEAVAHPPQELHALRPVTGDPAHDRDVERPIGPMSAADLLVNARGEPALVHALAREIPSADGVDLLCAFVRWHGLRLLMEPLAAHCRDGKPLRVITTVYTGSTERRALDWLVGLGAQVRVSYDTQSTRLHAKAWMFRRETGYFGVNDGSDLSGVRFTRGAYDGSELDKLYTGNDARVGMVLKQLSEKHRAPHAMRALGFCVSIAHAEFMARRFGEAGLPSLAVSAGTALDERSEAIKKLRSGEIRALFAVDLFNEGVDLPEVDTLLFLRPTESALVFLQQLGRGLRRHEGKDCVTVLDFIGQAHRQFRFDLRYRAVTGATRTEVEKQVQQGFPFLPAGCSIQLDRVTTTIVLNNVRSAIPSRRPAMLRELRALMESDRFKGRVPTLRQFLEQTGLELGDLYRPGAGPT